MEVGTLADGRIAIRNSNYPQAGVLFLTRAAINAWINGVKAGKFDNLTAKIKACTVRMLTC